MNQHIMKAAAALGVIIALATGCSSKGTGINVRLADPVLTSQENWDPQGGSGYQQCPGFDDLFGS
jgi:hypothetical protein